MDALVACRNYRYAQDLPNRSRGVPESSRKIARLTYSLMAQALSAKAHDRDTTTTPETTYAHAQSEHNP